MSSRYQYASGFPSTPPHMLPPFQGSPSTTPRSGRASPAFAPSKSRPPPAPIQTKSYYTTPPSFLNSGARTAPLLPSFAVGRQLPPPVPTTRGPPSLDIGSYSVSRGSLSKHSIPATQQHSFAHLPAPGNGSPRLAKRRSIDSGLGQSRHATYPPTTGGYPSNSSRRPGQAIASEQRQPPSASASRVSHFRTASPIPLQPSKPMPVHAPHHGLGTPRPLPSSLAPPSSQLGTAPPRSHSSLAGPLTRASAGTVNPADIFPAYPSFSSFSQLPQYNPSSSSSPSSSLSRPSSALAHSRPASPGGRPRTPSQLQRRRGIDAVDPDSPIASLRSSPISSKPRPFSPPSQYQLPPMLPSPPSAGRNVRARAASLSTAAAAPDFGRYYEGSSSDSFEDEYKPTQRKETTGPKAEYQRRKSFSSNELRVLAAAWNAGHYYPASSLVENICIATGLTRPQVRGWFANRRQRASEYEKVLIHQCGQLNGIPGIAF